ncbi:hypothetical protein O7598_20650 [Micromonospora sp. WMMC241]|uniref:hypothetical protein n=1 Tax=Micromonospora sp. WMMC241 TaxID=3015159 RepID=UPI0022B69F44|nr:hypothetical protein [Micromonospora sp. WMMC241]MCZ7438835.1 hypothetical protein [Micromonospora sp. WMMC241]
MKEHQSAVRVAWRDIAISAIVFSVALIAVISIVVTVKDVDTLSVVALALAVIAFVAQIIMFIVQAASANDQREKAQDVYAQTMRALTLIEEKMEGTRQTVHTMSDKLLSRVLAGTLPEPVAKEALAVEIESLDPPTPSTRFPRQRPVRPPSTAGDVNGRPGLAYPPPAKSGEKSAEIIRLMRQFPTGSDMEAARSALNGIPMREAYYLSLLAEDEIRSGKPGSRFGAGLSILPTGKELYKKGLVRQIRLPHDPKKTVFVLTEKGRNAARVFSATGNPPPGFPQELLDIIKQVADYQEALMQMRNQPDPDIPVDET